MRSIAGDWYGSIQVNNQHLSIIVSFFKDGTDMDGMISIPAQGLKNHPLSEINCDEYNINFKVDIQGMQMVFDGSIDHETIEGKFIQHDQSFPFELSFGEPEKDKNEDKFLSVDTGQGTLYGELETPEESESYPIFLIIPGSGLTDRDGNIMGLPGNNNSLKMSAQELKVQGVASIRYDSRGVHKNEHAVIPESDLTFDQLVADAVLWIEKLKEDHRFSKVGIIGHSQGSLVGMIAAQRTNADVFISLAGAGRPFDHLIYNQLQEQLSDDKLEETEEILNQLKSNQHVENISPELQNFFRPSVQSFLSSWMQYDPAQEIQKLGSPVLIVNGDHDLQVSVSEAHMLHEAKTDSEMLLIPEMNHVLKKAPNVYEENKQTYANPELPLSDGLMEGVMNFLRNNEMV